MPTILIGQTGSGKTTLANSLGEALGLPVISSGKIAAAIADADAFARAGLEKGDYAPELAIREEVVAQMEAAMATAGDFIMEGFPRKLPQLVITETVLAPVRPIYIELDVWPITCIRRLVARNRKGDHPDAIAVKWLAYEHDTQPVINLAKPYLINGTADPARVLDATLSLIRTVHG